MVPDFWKGMMGDDWLNNAATRDAYGRHLERELEREIEADVSRVRSLAAAAGLAYETRTMIGKPAECLVEWALALRPDLVVIGSPRPAGTRGLRSRMQMERLLRGLPAPLLVVPHPG